MNTFESLLLAVSNLLFYPVIAGIFFMLAQQAIAAGRLLNEVKSRKVEKRQRLIELKKQINAINETQQESYDHSILSYTIALRKWENNYSRSMNGNRLVIKAGPAVGLMGTLIPMGTAMASLSQGDMMVMSVNMVTAFTTTVVGMACGLSAFINVHIRNSWFQRDRISAQIYCEKQTIVLKKEAIKISEPILS